MCSELGRYESYTEMQTANAIMLHHPNVVLDANATLRERVRLSAFRPDCSRLSSSFSIWAKYRVYGLVHMIRLCWRKLLKALMC